MTHHFAILAATTGAGFAPQFWWVIAIWVTLMGAFLGSFMNVVIYRLPAGKPLAYPGSACPACGHAVRWFDNVPVLSWMILGARCRDCRTPISGRYPLVEATVGAMFLWLVMAEVYSGGVTLPSANAIGGLSMHVVEGARRTTAFDGALWQSFAFRLLMLCTLFCAALIELDRRCPPIKLYWPAMLVGLALPVWKPLLRPIPAWSNDLLATSSPAWADGFLGLAVGLLVGGLVSIGARNLNGVLAAMMNLSLVGVFLGWQAVTCLAMATAAAMLVIDRITKRLPDSLILFGLTFLFILNWGRLAEQWPNALGARASVATNSCVWTLVLVCGVMRSALTNWRRS